MDLIQKLDKTKAAAQVAAKKIDAIRSQMRIEIAQDVIEQIKAGKIHPAHRTYVSWNSTPKSDDVFDEYKKLQLLPHLSRVEKLPRLKTGQLNKQLKSLPPCNVCVIGASFIAAVDRFNRLKLKPNMIDSDHDSIFIEEASIREFLLDFYDNKQLAEIEAAFEGKVYSSINPDYQYNHLPMDAAKADIRLVMIMRNIIRNKGTFMPKQFIKRMETKGYLKRI